jgi:hypothetical protein
MNLLEKFIQNGTKQTFKKLPLSVININNDYSVLGMHMDDRITNSQEPGGFADESNSSVIIPKSDWMIEDGSPNHYLKYKNKNCVINGVTYKIGEIQISLTTITIQLYAEHSKK